MVWWFAGGGSCCEQGEEFLEVHDPVAVLIRAGDRILKLRLVHALAEPPQHDQQLVRGHGSAAIRVDAREAHAQLVRRPR